MATNSKKLDDKLKQDEARKFSMALLKNKQMLEKYTDVLAESAKNPDQKITKANNFIQHKLENGIDNYQTDLDYVLQAQQTLPTFMLIYWSGFYKTTVGEIDSREKKEGESFVIAATLDPDAPIHLGLARTNIISPTFNNLILKWDKIDGIQSTCAELVFNLVPDESGNIVKTFAGNYDDGSGKKLLTGVAQPQIDKTPAEKDKEKSLLPPELKELFPLISAIVGIVGAVGSCIGMAWTVRQWKDRNVKAALEAENARNNPEDPEAQRNARQAQEREAQAQDTVNMQEDRLDRRGSEIEGISNEDMIQGNKIIAPKPEIPASNSQALKETVKAVRENPELQAAAEQSVREVPRASVVETEANGGESDVGDGLLSSIEAEGE